MKWILLLTLFNFSLYSMAQNRFNPRVDILSPGQNAGEQANGAPHTDILSPEQKQKFSTAGPEDITDENFPEMIESFDYPDADIRDVIKAIGELTGKNFIVDPSVNGKITIIAPSRITVAEAYKAFLSALAINKLTIVPSGEFLKIRQARQAQKDNIETYYGEYFPNSDQMITRIVQLKHISAADVTKDLGQLRSSEGDIMPYESTNSLIISDYGSNVERIVKIISRLDLPGFEDKLEVVRIQHAAAKSIAELIEAILEQGKQQTRGRPTRRTSRFSRRFSSSQGNSVAYYNVIPDERTNSLIIAGNAAGIEKIKKLIAQLDFPLSAEEAGGPYVYYVKHGEASKISQIFSGIAKDSGSSSAPSGRNAPPQKSQPIFGGDVNITADEDTNSLIITANKSDYEIVLNLLKKIDIARDQVYVEAIILELGVEDSNDWRIGYYQYDPNSNGYIKGGFNGGLELQSLLNPVGGKGLILPFGDPKNKVKINFGQGGEIEVPSLLGFLTMIKEHSRTNILSTPQITVLDNEEGTIEVGERVPTSTTTSSTAAGQTQSVTMEDATIKLKIKPFISPDSDSIKLQIDQKIKQPSSKVPQAQDLRNSSIILTTRNLETSVVVNDGDTIVLGGLISDQQLENITKVPILGDIPILGWLFKSKRTVVTKSNLLVFLTPTIIRTKSEQKKLLTKKLTERIDFIKSAGGIDSHGAKVDQMAKNIKSDQLELNPLKNKNDFNSPAENNIDDDFFEDEDIQTLEEMQ